MSLKTFHIIFITASFLLALGFGIWAVREFRQSGAWTDLAMGLISFALVPIIALYARYFLRKLKHISYL